MATIKSFTSLEQSKKLAEILPLESADQTWARIAIAGANLDVPEEMQYRHNGDMPFQYYSSIGIPCWSLAALLSVLPNNENISTNLSKGGYRISTLEYTNSWFVDYEDETNSSNNCVTSSDNPIDACYEMIIRLHELNLL